MPGKHQPFYLRGHRRLWNQASRNAKRRGIHFDLSFFDLVEIIARSKGRCELTGVEFSNEKVGGRRRPWAMSLDRINSKRGYTFDNCRLLCVAANIATSEWGDVVLLTMLKAMKEKNRDSKKQVRRPRAVGPGRS